MIDEKQDLLQTYINLGYKLEQLERYRRAISDNYYKSHSLVGGAVMGDNELYQRALPPFIATWEIVQSETIITQRIERLAFRYRHFKRFCDTLDIEELKRLETFKNDEINDTQKLAIDEIEQIEEATAWRYYDGVKIDEDFNPLGVTMNGDKLEILQAIDILQGDFFTW